MSASKIGSSTIFTAACTIRSRTAGIDNGRCSAVARLRDEHPPRRQRPTPPVPQSVGQLVQQPVDPVLLDFGQGGPVDARRAVVAAHRDPRPPQDVSAIDLVPQRMKPSPRIGLGRPVKRMLQGTNRIHNWIPTAAELADTALTGHLLHNTTHERSSGPSLTGGCVVRSARSVLRPPPTPTRPPAPLPGFTGYRTPRSSNTFRRSPGRGGPPQFPPSLSERSAPLTPGSPSAPAHSGLHRFHGLRRDSGARLSLPTQGDLTTPQASLHATDRSVAPPKGFRRWASTRPVSRPSRQPATGPPDSYPDRTHTGKRRRALRPKITYTWSPPACWSRERSRLGAALMLMYRRVRDHCRSLDIRFRSLRCYG